MHKRFNLKHSRLEGDTHSSQRRPYAAATSTAADTTRFGPDEPYLKQKEQDDSHCGRVKEAEERGVCVCVEPK